MLRHPTSGAAVVQSTAMTLTPAADAPFSPSKFGQFDDAQRAAVVAVLEALAETADLEETVARDVEAALLHWWDLPAGQPPPAPDHTDSSNQRDPGKR